MPVLVPQKQNLKNGYQFVVVNLYWWELQMRTTTKMLQNSTAKNIRDSFLGFSNNVVGTAKTLFMKLNNIEISRKFKVLANDNVNDYIESRESVKIDATRTSTLIDLLYCVQINKYRFWTYHISVNSEPFQF